jgi:uncharacterized protein (TIGR02217 family)
MTGFLEKRRLPVDVAPNTRSSPKFRTTIKRLRGGGEYRNGLWSDPLREFTIQYNARTKGRVEDELIDFIMETRGSLYGFRVRDWSDYQAVDEEVAVGDGTTYYFPLYKQYGTYSRRILKPIDSGFSVKFDGVAADIEYFPDIVNGYVVFATPPKPNVVIRWSGTFDVPVRFEDDAIDIISHTDDIASVATITLVEERTRDNANPAGYEELRELLAQYSRAELYSFIDVLYEHMNVKWRDTG